VTWCPCAQRAITTAPLLVIAALFAGTAGLGCKAAAPAGSAAAPSPVCTARIARVWHGRTLNNKADAHAAYLAEGIKKFLSIKGNLGYQMMRETVGDETHFMVISYWASRDAIKAYAGDDIRKTRHAPRDAEFLIEPKLTVMNYDLAVTALSCAP